MKRVIIGAAILLLVLGTLFLVKNINVTNDANVLTSLVSNVQSEKTRRLLKDRGFEHGLAVRDPEVTFVETGEYHYINGVRCPKYYTQNGGYTHNLYVDNRSYQTEPTWTLGQWNSQASIFPNNGTRQNWRTYIWENWYKKIVVGKNPLLLDYVLLGVNGAREYEGEWSDGTSVCYETSHPSLFISQKPNYVNHPSVGEMNKLLFSLTSKVTREDITPDRLAAWEKEGHTAHFKIHFNFMNMREDRDRSQGYGQSFGIGINLYDARNRDSDYAEKIFYHRPRQRLMLNIASEDLNPTLRTALHSGNWAKIEKFDILPYAERALRLAIQKGAEDDSYDSIISEDLDDYYLTGFNMGWEVTSLHNVEMKLTKLDLVARYND